MSVTILLMAAGASTRMKGRDKLLEDVGGTPLLRDRAQMCLRSKADHVRVVISPEFPARKEVLADLDVEIIETQGAHLDLSHSLQCGTRNLNGPAMIVLADLPNLTHADLDKILDAAAAHPDAKILRGATPDGKPGHPVFLTVAALPLIANLTGDKGVHVGDQGGELLPQLVKLDANRPLDDLDTPQDWARWRAAKPQT